MAKIMEAIFRSCAELDVHSNTVAACVRRIDAQGEIHAEARTFGIMTHDLLSLCDWLIEEGVSHVGMESTGVFWEPIYNILEEQFQIVPVNARHIKNVPGRNPEYSCLPWPSGEGPARGPTHTDKAVLWSAERLIRSVISRGVPRSSMRLRGLGV
jgi:hypothetical protein